MGLGVLVAWDDFPHILEQFSQFYFWPFYFFYNGEMEKQGGNGNEIQELGNHKTDSKSRRPA